MDGRFINDQDHDFENSPENSEDSPRSSTFNDSKITSISSPKKSRRGVQKRVVSVPIRDVEGSRLKGGESNTPPSDSWAWRKYGQKPIKGSPYPRGYYRCSSSKGCPARKQVERSRVDPSMLVVTYSCEHNHPWPANRNNHHHNNHQTTTTTSATAAATVTVETSSPPTTTAAAAASNSDQDNTSVFTNQLESDVPDEKFPNMGDGYGWFSEFESTSSTILESPTMAYNQGISISDTDMTMIFSMREEDELLFADLEELPECSTVFRRGILEREEERRRCGLTPWCGTTG